MTDRHPIFLFLHSRRFARIRGLYYPRGDRSGRAFTLIEVLAALIIFSVAIIGLIEAMGSATSTQSDLVNRQRAALLAENIMEEIRYSGERTMGDDSGKFSGADAAFSWASNIEESDTDQLLAVTVTISWQSGPAARAREYALSTMMFDRDEDLLPEPESESGRGGAGGASPNGGGSREGGGQ